MIVTGILVYVGEDYEAPGKDGVVITVVVVLAVFV